MTTEFSADVLIVGSGVAGALVAARLAATGVKVCIMEAGAPVKRAEAVQTYWKALIKVPESAYPPVPQAGSAMVLLGSGRTHSTIARIRARGVKYCPAPDLVSSALRSSKPS